MGNTIVRLANGTTYAVAMEYENARAYLNVSAPKREVKLAGTGDRVEIATAAIATIEEVAERRGVGFTAVWA